MSDVVTRLKSHPHWPAVESIYHKLVAHGYKAFLAGGCVRDALLGVPANDLDVATDATPGQIEKLFDKTVDVGKSFGVIRVLSDGADIEVATFRTDGSYVDGRRPQGIHFSSPEEDAQRRDFTVNALFFDLSCNQVLDFVGGIDDLKKHCLATVGEAEHRFREDHLRLLRAARFVAQLNFTVADSTLEAMTRLADLVTSVSGERLHEEMAKLLRSKHVEKGLAVMVQSGLMKVLFPFRSQDSSWPSLTSRTDWQNFALFFRATSYEELKKLLKALRFSNKDAKAIENAWFTFKKPEEFLSWSLSAQLIKLPDEGFLWAVQTLINERNAGAARFEKLLQEWKSWGEVLPKAFLTGEDAKGLQGRAIGRGLAKAYDLQLERKITSREAALQWLEEFKKDPHG